MFTSRLIGYRIFYLGSAGLSRFLAAEKLTEHRQTSYETGEIICKERPLEVGLTFNLNLEGF